MRCRKWPCGAGEPEVGTGANTTEGDGRERRGCDQAQLEEGGDRAQRCLLSGRLENLPVCVVASRLRVPWRPWRSARRLSVDLVLLGSSRGPHDVADARLFVQVDLDVSVAHFSCRARSYGFVGVPASLPTSPLIRCTARTGPLHPFVDLACPTCERSFCRDRSVQHFPCLGGHCSESSREHAQTVRVQALRRRLLAYFGETTQSFWIATASRLVEAHDVDALLLRMWPHIDPLVLGRMPDTRRSQDGMSQRGPKG